MTSDCGCCEGIESLTPEIISNRPGLDALDYRAGRHGSFFESMQARLSQVEVEVKQPDGTTVVERPLAGLSTRDRGDPIMALLDGWATIADVLTFYQERIANEGYLRTATERRSILELARLVGYTLRPGVAATVYLAYTIDENLQDKTDIPLYSLSQSVPGPGELPQSFETVEKLPARARWNNLQPRLTRPQTMASIEASQALYLKGVTTNLRQGDPVLLDDGIARTLWRVLDVNVDAPNNRTIVLLADWMAGAAAGAGFPASLLADYEAYKEKLEQGIADALQEIEGATATSARRAAVILKHLADTVANTPDLTFSAQLQTTLAELGTIRDELPANATVVKPWLDATIEFLTTQREGAVRLLQAARAAEFANVMPPLRGSGSMPPPERDELLSVMEGLGRAASLPPRNAMALRRDLKTAFTARSDLGLQVAGIFKPPLKEQLPVALANVQATAAVPVQAYALRVKAGVYGSTAPKRAIVDDRGRVIATVDWPIDGLRRLVVRVTPLINAGQILVQVQSRMSGGAFEHVKFQLSQGGQDAGTSGDLTVKVNVANAAAKGLSVVIRLAGLEQTLTFVPVGENEGWELTSKSNDGVDFESLPVTAEKIVLASNRRVSEIYLDAFGLRGAGSATYATELPQPPQPANVVALDAPYEQLTPGGFAVVVRDPQASPLISQIQAVRTSPHNLYNLPSKVTDLTLADDWLVPADLYLADIEQTLILTGSEKLALAEEPIAEPICGADQWIELDGVYSDLQAGRWLIVAGSRADILDASGTAVPGLESAELVMLADVQHDLYRGQSAPPITNNAEPVLPLPGDANHTFIRLARQLSFCYGRDKVKIYGNVVKATHGETRQETLGAGDGSQPFQSFVLKQTPLTFVSAPTAAGAASTLRVYLNGVEWHATDSFAGSGPADHFFLFKTGDDDKVTVTGGDGKTSARFPTGLENVRARYRQGLGKGGNVRAKQITLLQARPLGVKEVINPLPASGGAGRESGDQARKNVPLGVLALDRLVSVRDYADFTRTFAGIGKAVSAQLPYGDRELVHVTIAGAEDIPIEPTSDLYRNLLLALRELGDPDVPVRVDLRELMLLMLQANVSVDPDYEWEGVATAIRQKLLATFSFENQELGQSIWLSQVIGVIQRVEGVVYVDVDAFGGIPEKLTDAAGIRRLLTPQEIIAAAQKMLADQVHRPAQSVAVGLARVEKGAIRPAQLAFFSPDVPGALVLNQAQ